MTVKIEVFTSPTCPHCPSAVRLAKEIEKEMDDVKVTETSTMTRGGVNRARMFNVMSVPTLFVKGPEFDRIGFRGTPSKQKLVEAIEISQGVREWQEPKSMMKKLREKIPIKIKF